MKYPSRPKRGLEGMGMTNHPAKTSFFYWQGQLYDPGQFTFTRTVSSLKFELLCHYKSGINP